MTYSQFDLVKLPFPFTDKDSNKVRPAIIVSHLNYTINTNHYIVIMVTSSKQTNWVDDIHISDLNSAGLPVPSKIRFKLFSLDERLVICRLGQLGKDDKEKLVEILKKYMAL